MKLASKILVIIILAGLLSSFVPPSYRVSKAQGVGVSVPTFETNPTIVGSTSGEFVQSLFEWAQTFVLSTLKKRLLDMLVDQIIQWIQGGGKPQFVTDWGGFLQDVANTAVGDFVQEIGAGFLCQPFNLRIQFDLRFKRFSQVITCTLDDIVGNIEAFYQDFRNGSWIGYTTSIEPQNNYFGAAIIAQSELEKRVGSKVQAAQNEALSGGGFLSTKKCQEDPNNPAGDDIDGDGKKGDIESTCEVTTPGQTIGNLVSKAVGSPIDFILTSEQLGDYAAAIADAVINRLIIEGVEGIRGLTTKNAPQRGVIPPVTGNCAGLSGTVLDACRRYIISSNNSFSGAQANLLSQIDKSFGPRQDAAASIDDSINSIKSYQTNLQNLLGQFSKKTLTACPLRDAHIKDIKDELSWSSTTVFALLDDKSKNQSFLDRLVKAQNDIKALATDDWAGLSVLVNQIQNSGILDFQGAVDFKSGKEGQNKDIKDRIRGNLSTFRQNLARCP